jgi:hypothetical protein
MAINFKHKGYSIYGCKTRVVTGLYIHTPGLRKLYGKDLGAVLGDLIQDPPVEIDNPSHWGLSPQGISVIQDATTGIYHAWDWIGAMYYPNAADIWMQVIEKDDNGRVPITKDLELLTEFESFRVLVHPHGTITQDVIKFKQGRKPIKEVPDCFLPEGDYRDMHIDPDSEQMCSSLWWQMCKGTPDDENKGYVNVEVGDLTYRAVGYPKNYLPAWKLAMIGKLPIGELHYVVGDMKENEPDVNETIEKALSILEGMDLQLPLYATDN